MVEDGFPRKLSKGEKFFFGEPEGVGGVIFLFFLMIFLIWVDLFLDRKDFEKHCFLSEFLFLIFFGDVSLPKGIERGKQKT